MGNVVQHLTTRACVVLNDCPIPYVTQNSPRETLRWQPQEVSAAHGEDRAE